MISVIESVSWAKQEQGLESIIQFRNKIYQQKAKHKESEKMNALFKRATTEKCISWYSV